jgi:hypothetical protein
MQTLTTRGIVECRLPSLSLEDRGRVRRSESGRFKMRKKKEKEEEKEGVARECLPETPIIAYRLLPRRNSMKIFFLRINVFLNNKNVFDSVHV